MNASISTRQASTRRADSPLGHRAGFSSALAGLVGGAAMMLSSTLLASAYGLDIWFQWKAIGSLILGQSALAQLGFATAPVLLGVLIHFAVSVVLGILFAIVTHRILKLPSDYGAPAVTGLVFGLGLWLVGYFLLPVLAPVMMGVYAPAFILQHIVFGTATSLAYSTLQPQPYAASA